MPETQISDIFSVPAVDQAAATQTVGDDIFENKLLKEVLQKCEILEQALKERTLELERANEQLEVEFTERKEAEEKFKQAKVAAAFTNQQLLAELAERKQELESVNEQLQIESAEHGIRNAFREKID